MYVHHIYDVKICKHGHKLVNGIGKQPAAAAAYAFVPELGSAAAAPPSASP
jgi:hypothetical protein